MELSFVEMSTFDDRFWFVYVFHWWKQSSDLDTKWHIWMKYCEYFTVKHLLDSVLLCNWRQTLMTSKVFNHTFIRFFYRLVSDVCASHVCVKNHRQSLHVVSYEFYSSAYDEIYTCIYIYIYSINDIWVVGCCDDADSSRGWESATTWALKRPTSAGDLELSSHPQYLSWASVSLPLRCQHEEDGAGRSALHISVKPEETTSSELILQAATKQCLYFSLSGLSSAAETQQVLSNMLLLLEFQWRIHSPGPGLVQSFNSLKADQVSLERLLSVEGCLWFWGVCRSSACSSHSLELMCEARLRSSLRPRPSTWRLVHT